MARRLDFFAGENVHDRGDGFSHRVAVGGRARGKARWWRGLTQLDDLGSGTQTTEPLRLERGDDEKHTHRNGGRLGKDEPEIAHGLSGRRFGGDLGCLSAAVRPRGMRGATRTPLVPAIIAQNRRARRLAAANGCSSISSLGRPAGHPESIVNSQSESMSWTKKFGRTRGFLYNFGLSDNAFPSQGFSMSDQSGVNRGRRSLVIASACAGGAATVATAVPFAASMLPSERAEALGAPVEVDISQLILGEKMTVEWRGQPVWILRRTKEMLEGIKKADGKVADPRSERKKGELTPEYARNEFRSIKPEYLVVVGICTHLGCSPQDRLKAGPEAFESDWTGGF